MLRSDNDPDVMTAYDLMRGIEELAYGFGAATERLRSLKYISGAAKAHDRLEDDRIESARKLIQEINRVYETS